MIAQIPILVVSLPGKISHCGISMSTNCIYMHFKYSFFDRSRFRKILDILSDHIASIMRICASGFHDFCSACKTSFYEKGHLFTCFGMDWPPGAVPGDASNVFPVSSGLHSVVLCSASDPPDSNLSTLIIYKLRNRSLLPKSRERSIRQGGRMGDKHRRYKTCQ